MGHIVNSFPQHTNTGVHAARSNRSQYGWPQLYLSCIFVLRLDRTLNCKAFDFKQSLELIWWDSPQKPFWGIMIVPPCTDWGSHARCPSMHVVWAARCVCHPPELCLPHGLSYSCGTASVYDHVIGWSTPVVMPSELWAMIYTLPWCFQIVTDVSLSRSYTLHVVFHRIPGSNMETIHCSLNAFEWWTDTMLQLWFATSVATDCCSAAIHSSHLTLVLQLMFPKPLHGLMKRLQQRTRWWAPPLLLLHHRLLP